MTNKYIVLLAVLAFSMSAQAQKLYKIVDEKGNVTFSQFPPQDKQQNATVDDITVSGGSKSVITDKLDGKYCGDIRLDSAGTRNQSMRNHVQNLENKKSQWEHQQAQLNKRIDDANQNRIKQNQYRSSSSYARSSSSQSRYYQETVERNSAMLRDLRCALDWVDAELDGTSEIVASNKKERARLEGIRNELQARLDRRCGELPAYDPSVGYNSASRKNWYECSDKLRKEIDRLDRAINEV